MTISSRYKDENVFNEDSFLELFNNLKYSIDVTGKTHYDNNNLKNVFETTK